MPITEVRRFLHCNYNCGDVDALEAFYTEVLGLRAVMRTENADDEGIPFGLYGETASRTVFLYDHRGGRYSSSLELIQWLVPPTFGSVYPDPWHIGIHAAGYTAADLDQTADLAVERGGTLVRRGDQWLLLRDPEGVALEVHQADGPSEGRYLRLVCTDLDETTAWWRELGFQPGALSDVPGSSIWPEQGDRQIVDEVALVATDDDRFGILLTKWSGPAPIGPPYAVPYHRGLYRMAMAVDDVQSANARLREEGVARQLPYTFQLPGTKLTDGLTILFLREPDGLLVELVDRPRLPSRS
jgi:catechol 2,3-dioxygenase-like lactoylglutathione lyase family enzyme